MHIREADPADASEVVDLFQRLYAETKFLLYEPGEAVPAVRETADRMALAAQNETGAMFVAEAQGKLIGVAFGNRGGAKKTRHSLFLVMAVLQAWTGRGVGRSLIEAREGWAVSKRMHRLELTVSTMNHRAISLYEKVGFAREGVKRHSLNIEGRYVDELYMSKLVGP